MRQINFGLLGKMPGGCSPVNLLKKTSSQKELIDKMVAVSRADQENYIKSIVEGGCVQISFDEDKCKFDSKYISKTEMINPK